MESQEGCSQKPAGQQAVEITPLSDLKAYKYHYRIRVRVCRLWKPTKFNSAANDGLHYVLVDRQGNSVHAFMPEERVEDVTEKPVQRQCYDIYQFNTRSYNPTSAHLLRVVENRVEVQFNDKTVFCRLAETNPPIPTNAFRLIEFGALEADMGTQAILTDVYGCIKAIKPPHMQYIRRQNRTKFKCDVTIENLRRKTFTVAFWGQLAKKFDAKAIMNIPGSTGFW